jgi:hypothetical protein
MLMQRVGEGRTSWVRYPGTPASVPQGIAVYSLIGRKEAYRAAIVLGKFCGNSAEPGSEQVLREEYHAQAGSQAHRLHRNGYTCGASWGRAALRRHSPPFPSPGSVNLNTLEVHLSTPFSIRNLLRNTAPPEFGDALLDVLQSRDPGKPLHGNSKAAMVQRGAQLFGIDLVHLPTAL